MAGPLNAVILGAGRATRLDVLQLGVPKILVEIGGEPLLARQLRYLARLGVQRVVVNAHDRAEQIVDFVQKYRGPPDVRVLVEPVLLGTAGGVRNALPALGPDAFLVMYGDILTDVDFRPMSVAHRQTKADATLAVYWAENAAEKGVVAIDSSGFVTSFVEKPAGSVAGLVNAGLYVIEPRLVSELALGEAADFGSDLFPRAIVNGRRLLSYRIGSPVRDVGTPAGLAAARAEHV